MRSFLLALLLAGGLLAQRHKVNINTETPEGQALQAIGQETDDAKRLAMLEKFTQDYGKSENLAWVYAQMQPLYAMAIQTTDPRKKVDLIETLQGRNPQSQYMGQVLPLEFQAYRQIGDNDKATALAEKILATDQTNEDMLLVVADNSLQKGKDP